MKLELETEGLAAQLFKDSYPKGPLWHVLREDKKERWREAAASHIRKTETAMAQFDRASWHVRSLPRFVRDHFVRKAFEQKMSVGEVLTEIARKEMGSLI